MMNPIVGTKCILQEPGGEEIVCRVTSASLRQCIGCVPEIDLTVYVDGSLPVHSVPPLESKLTIDPFAPKVVIEPPEFRYAFRHDAKYKAKQVIFNPPATVVLWTDGTKTVVKCDPEDTFNETTGVALCYMKKALGNTSRELNKALRKARG
jgi:hypothetical protein